MYIATTYITFDNYPHVGVICGLQNPLNLAEMSNFLKKYLIIIENSWIHDAIIGLIR